MPDLLQVYEHLRAIMEPYAARLARKVDTEVVLYVDTTHLMKNKKPLFFGAVQLKRAYVSYHLMPVYVRPCLLERVSPALRKRMQGKSCFNFTQVDAELFAELAEVTRAGYASYKEQGFA